MNSPGGNCHALLFDVFGTLVDWRSSVTRGLANFFLLNHKGVCVPGQIDWEVFALDWRARYQPSMQAVRDGSREFVVLDVLHRESLLETLDQHSVTGLSRAQLDELTLLWHQLNAWPDVKVGLGQLRTKYTLAAVSNGNTKLLKNLSIHAQLGWHVSLGAEPAQAYKPMPQAYLASADMLALEPSQCMMVAAHNDDLHAAGALGFRTAYVNRPTEYGPRQVRDTAPESNWDYCVESLTELADLLLNTH